MRIAIYGYGNLGRGVECSALCHKDVELVGVFTRRAPETVKTVSGIPVYHTDTLEEFTRANSVEIAVLTVPKEAAYSVTERLLRAGIRGLWNFANMELKVDDPGVIVENVHMGDSLMTLCYAIKNQSSKDSNNA